jgi:hypothetical protein
VTGAIQIQDSRGDEKAMGPMTAESFDIFEMVSGRFKTSHGETKAARSFMLL